MIVDFSRFPTNNPVESELFHLRGVKFKERLAGLDFREVQHSLISIFDPQIVFRGQQAGEIHELSQGSEYSFAYMPELNGVGKEQIERAADLNFKAVIFHPYLQNINHQNFCELKSLAKTASDLGMLVCVCAAFGSSRIHKLFPLEAVTAVCEVVKTPVIIVHGGGARVLEAFLIAEAFQNVFLDTSFSLHYWWGSSVESDFAFAMKRLGSERFIFGSDAPFRPLVDTLDLHYNFTRKYGFNETDLKNLMGLTAANILCL